MSCFDSLQKSHNALLGAASAAVLAMMLATSAAVAADGDAEWIGAFGSAFENTSNWLGAQVPTGTAIFNTGSLPTVVISANHGVKALRFEGGGTFTFENNALFWLDGAGIVVAGNGTNPTINNQGGAWYFRNQASAGSATINTAGGGVAFWNQSTADNATITIAPTGSVSFKDSSNAGTAKIWNQRILDFHNGSSAASATITNDFVTSFEESAKAGSSKILNNERLYFRGLSSAENATITTAEGSETHFDGSAQAGNATIYNKGALWFRQRSSAANATITTENGGFTSFLANAQGGEARLITHAGGRVIIAVSDLPSITVGAIEGAGDYYLGANTLIVNSTTTDEVSGVIRDDGFVNTGGSLVKRGTGTLILSGQNTYTGATTVEGGSLVVNGSIASSSGTTVHAGSVLGGVGTVSALTVQGGTVAPGHNGIGTLSVQGNVQFGPGSVFQVQVNPAGQGDKLAATGSATIGGGTVAVQAQSGTYAPSTTYTILTAGSGVTGRFDQLTHDFAFLTPTLNYTANDVQLTFARNSTPLDDVANNPNQGGAGQGVGGTGVNNLTRAFLSLTREEAQQALAQLSGEAHASAQSMVVHQARQVQNALLARTLTGSAAPAQPLAFAAVSQSSVAYAADLAPRSAPVATPVAVAPGLGIETWGQVFGSWGNTESSAAHAGVDRSTGGFLVGADAGLAGAWRAGLAGGYSRTSFDMPGVLSSGAVESVHVAAYGAGSLGAVQLRAGAAYTHSDIDVSRSVAFRGFSDALSASFDSNAAQVFGEVGYRFGFGGVSLEPFAGLSHLHVASDAYAEEGGLAALTGQGRDFAVTASTLGLRAALTLPVGSGAVSAKGMLGWRHGFGDLVPVTVHRFVAGDTPFAVSGAPLDRDALVVEAGLDWAVTPLLTVGVKYDGQIGNRDQEHAVRGQASLRF